MRLAILSTATYPSNLANRVHILNMSKAFAKIGVSVTLFTKSVTLDQIPTYEIKNFEYLKRCYSLVYTYIKQLKKENFDVIFIREPRVLFWYIFLSYCLFYRNKNVIYEVHDMPRDFLEYCLVKFMASYITCMVVITKNLKTDLCNLNNALKDKTIVLPDGVDPELFNIESTQQDARQELRLPFEKKIIVYTGSLYEWKGIYILKDVARKMSDSMFLFVGGKEEEAENFKDECKDIPNIVIKSYVAQKLIPYYMKAADVLVLPNTAKIPLSNKYTSPLKLFEYMMSKRPIVASATPAICELLQDSKNAYLCNPDDVESLYKKILTALTDPKAETITQNAYNDVWKYTWDKRVELLLNFFGKTKTDRVHN